MLGTVKISDVFKIVESKITKYVRIFIQLLFWHGENPIVEVLGDFYFLHKIQSNVFFDKLIIFKSILFANVN